MTKKYIRYCDNCEKEIVNLYDYGVTTMYKNIRIGRGCTVHNYADNSILNHVSETVPDDHDSYGTGWRDDKNNEFSFCSPDCLIEFLTKLYKDTYNSSLDSIKREKKENLDITFEEFKKKHGVVIQFFQRIQTIFSKDVFRGEAMKEADSLIEQIKKIKKELEATKR